MSNDKPSFSRSPDDVLGDALSKGYAGVRFEQGVPVLDRDLNLMGDLLAATTRRALAHFIGDGLAEMPSGFFITFDGSAEPGATPVAPAPLDNDFWISGPGYCLVDGLVVFNEKTVQYTKQPGGYTPLTLPTPAQVLPGFPGRVDLVYVVATLVEEAADPSLLNDDDVGVRTSVRRKVGWTVRVLEGLTVADADFAYLTAPDPDAGDERRVLRFAPAEVSLDRLRSLPSFALGSEPRIPLALLFRAPGTTRIDMISDVRPAPLTLRAVARRVTELDKTTIHGVMGARVNDLWSNSVPALGTRVSSLENLNLGDRVTKLEETLPQLASRIKALEDGYQQGGWWHCTECLTVFYDGDGGISICPKGGTHKRGPTSYVLRYTLPAPATQSGWRCCFKCRGLFHPSATGNIGCPAATRRQELLNQIPNSVFDPRDPTGIYSSLHEGTSSLEYMVPVVGQPADVSWCKSCQALFVPQPLMTPTGKVVSMGYCSANPGHVHDNSGSGYYTLTRG